MIVMVLPLIVEVVLALFLVIVAMTFLAVLSMLIGFLPAIIVAVIVWFLSHSLFYAALAFVVVAFLWVLAKKK
jgi:hypothetical protein